MIFHDNLLILEKVCVMFSTLKIENLDEVIELRFSNKFKENIEKLNWNWLSKNERNKIEFFIDYQLEGNKSFVTLNIQIELISIVVSSSNEKNSILEVKFLFGFKNQKWSVHTTF